MNKQYTSVFLIGPWLSGKSTLGKRVAERMEWGFIDMDQVIVKDTGMTIDQLTKNGTDWQLFRQTELEHVEKLLEMEHIAVGCGGGVGVNDIVKEGTDKTFGTIEYELLKSRPKALKVVLLPNQEVFLRRVLDAERKKFDTFRPLLDEQHAVALQEELKKFADDPKKQREVYIEGKGRSALALYQRRVDLYRELGDIVIDTGITPIDEAVDEIVKAL